jgi:hypothetical protein
MILHLFLSCKHFVENYSPNWPKMCSDFLIKCNSIVSDLRYNTVADAKLNPGLGGCPNFLAKKSKFFFVFAGLCSPFDPTK